MEHKERKERSFPSWVVFDKCIYRKDPASFREDDAETPSARSRASNGEPVLVSFRLAAPPAASRLYLHYPREAEEFNETALVAAHRDSVLFRVVVAPSSVPVDSSFPWCCHTDYFVCRAGGSSGLSLAGPLPPCYVDEWQMAGQGRAVHSHMLRARDIGLLRRGEEDFAVADLMMLVPDDTDAAPVEAELFRYRSTTGSRQWEAKRLPIICRGEDRARAGLHWWTTDAVVAFDGHLCWIDYFRGILFCDVLADEPQLRYVELPVEPPEGNPDHPEFGRAHPFVTRSVCVTDGGTMKFVIVARADGEIARKRKLGSGFTMTVWSLVTPLSSASERIGWAMDGAIEAEKLWMQDRYVELRLPPLSLEFPFVSLSEPDVVYAMLRERCHAAGNSTWMLVVDMRRKALRSVVGPYNEVEDFSREDDDDEMASRNIYRSKPVLPSLFSMHLNTHVAG
ncbi:hypothetical protein ACP70R_039580 [Stipagrostis hirtigluma subsp. patula]